MRKRVHIPPEDRIPQYQKVLFSFGGKMDYIATGMLTGILWMPFFNIGLGMKPATLGLILMALRGWDAITDPIMGNISDNTRTRWGRRRPFILLGAILTACFFPAFWFMPETLSETGKITYLILIGISFFTCFTVWSMPYYSMQMELTPNYDERTRLMAWFTFFGKLTALAGGWMLSLLSSSLFANPETGEPDIVHGMQVACWFIAGMIVFMGILPAIVGKERYYQKDASKQAKDPFSKSLKESVTCGPMWCLIGVAFFLTLGSYSISSLVQYINIYFISGGEISVGATLVGWKTTVLVVTGICCIPLWTKVGEILDKRTTLLCMLALAIIGQLLNIFCLRPDMPYLQLIPAVFEAASITAIWLFLPSMKADVADYDELKTHRRREGSLNAFFSWFMKAAMTGAMGVGGLVLTVSGFDAAIGEQPPEVLSRMFTLFISLPVVMWSLALLMVILYPLSRKRMAEIREQLEARRGKV
ncbi:MFS transporter [Tichowtungia aerotolerans]|uniref:MFS transporter n=1 Tax=Tichowtungia aerotolerans TaxID=2697043 RepID=A0A6P1MC44_9BACT|nr:MFS transporter [Tichowtungia aerotolerans]QHI69156.1 MFS transporter [Tichowtungia aerotolerans]